jgi:hypothetical protein
MPKVETFHLLRHKDITVISGTGIVALGVRFPDGVCVVRLLSEFASTNIYASTEDLLKVHGHAGNTDVVFD